jgi:tetratricopeptide (TPR) repeat protein
MTNSRTIFGALACVALLSLTAQSHADRVTNERELTLLPEYCRGTQGIREIAKLPKSAVESYYKTYGETYHHLHHYCWALMSEYNAQKIPEKGPRNNKLHQAIRDIDYVLNKNPPDTFQPLAEIYTTRARILFKLDRPGEAAADLVKATNVRPAYPPAFAQLSDYYLKIGQRDKAIAVLEEGVAHHASPTSLLRKLEKLGKPYQGAPGSALAKPPQEAPTAPADSAAVPGPNVQPAQAGPSEALPAATASPDGAPAEPPRIGTPENPYCRFCP